METVNPEFITIATALIGVLSSIITQVAKRYVPKQWRSLFSLGVSVFIAILSVAIVGLANAIGGDPIQLDAATITAVIFGVVGVAQAVYTTVHKLVQDNDGTPSDGNE